MYIAFSLQSNIYYSRDELLTDSIVVAYLKNLTWHVIKKQFCIRNLPVAKHYTETDVNISINIFY